MTRIEHDADGARVAEVRATTVAWVSACDAFELGEQVSDEPSSRVLRVKAWNENPRPFIWTKSAEEILNSLRRLLKRTNGAAH